MKYSVVIPVYNEYAVLPLFYDRIKKTMEPLGDYELVFVNDGSRDNSLDLLRAFAVKDKSVRVVSFSRNFGHQAAVSAGMDMSTGSAVVIIDCDLQDPPELIPDMIKKWRNGADIVYGRRIKRKGDSLFKKLTAGLFYKTIRLLGGQYIPANTGDFRLIDKKVCDTLCAMPERGRFLRGMTAWAGFKSEPIDFIRDERAAGKTGYSVKKMLKLAGDGITAFSDKPLKIPLVLGLILCFLSAAYLILGIIFYCLESWGITHILFSLVFLLISGLFISLGIFGLYLGRIYEETKARPLYIIDEKINLEEK